MAKEELPQKRHRGPKAVRVEPSAILDAAQVVFARDGVELGSVRAIAKEAQCDPSLLYYHFENKDAIFTALLERKFSKLIPDIEAVAENCALSRKTRGRAESIKNEHGRTPLQETLWQTMMVLHKHLMDDAGYRAMMRGKVMASKSVSNDWRNYISDAIDIISGHFLRGIESGELRNDIDVAATTFFFLRFYLELMDVFPQYCTIFLKVPPDEAFPKAEKQWFKLFWAGIANDVKPKGSKRSAG
ncbi:MAG: TetR/AcrR family transcriptional regulator [Holophagales bacterium]|nr:TetR/AcrR family transcriptional regulator [Holophagales bacterium]